MNLREMPCDIQAEACVLGSMILEKKALIDARAMVGENDFLRPAHAKIYTALCEMSDAGEPVDLVTLPAHIGSDVDRIGGVDYLIALVEGVPSSANLEYYAKIVKGKSRLRQMIVDAQVLLSTAYTREADPADVEMKLREMLYAQATNTDGATTTAARASQVVLNTLEAIHSGLMKPGVPTGYPRLDYYLGGGWKKADLTILAAHPSVGKSALAAKFAYNVAAAGGSAHIFSKEMTSEQIATRYLGMLAKIDTMRIFNGDAGKRQEESTELQAAQGMLDDIGDRLKITDQPMRVSEMQAEIERGVVESSRQVDLVVIDYLQIVPTGPGGNEQERISGISSGVKRIAQRLKIPVLLLSQFNRSAQYENRRPKLRDLRGSGMIESDANNAILLHRPDEPQINTAGEVGIECRIAKNRNGPQTWWEGDSAITLWFKPQFVDFTTAT